MHTLRYLFLDQMSPYISSLKDTNKQTDIIILIENKTDFTRVRHHKKKIAFWISVMRHFADELRGKGYRIHYLKIDDHNNPHDLTKTLLDLGKSLSANSIVITEPTDYIHQQEIHALKSKTSIPIVIKKDNRFLSDADFFSTWAQGKKQLRMEFFYREMRKKYNILMNNKQPEGGQWNYDSDNRKPPKAGLDIPSPYHTTIDAITQEAIDITKKHFGEHFGDMLPFYFAVTRQQALKVLSTFIKQRLTHFGTYQDAMIENEPWMYHSHISFYLNCGLLLPLECIQAAETAYQEKQAPLNAVEGFIRQILGWREFIRGIYQYKMPEYAHENFLNAEQPLPEFYWDRSNQNELSQAVHSRNQTKCIRPSHPTADGLGKFCIIVWTQPRSGQ
jgi:deoxyribodipyrimidine photolyase-related protein